MKCLFRIEIINIGFTNSSTFHFINYFQCTSIIVYLKIIHAWYFSVKFISKCCYFIQETAILFVFANRSSCYNYILALCKYFSAVQDFFFIFKYKNT